MKKIGFAVAVLVAASAAVAQPQNDGLQGRFNALIEQGLKDDPMLGVAGSLRS